MKESFKTLSKYEVLTLILLQVLSVYVIQRDLSWIFTNGPVKLYTDHNQREYMGFEFYYVTLSLIWPFILLIISQVLEILSRRKKSIGHVILINEENEYQFMFDPFYAHEIILENKKLRIITSILLYIPSVAILFHLIQGIIYCFYADFSLSTYNGPLNNSDELAMPVIYIILGVQFFVTLFSLIVVFRVPSTVLTNWKELKNTVTNK